MGRFVCLTLAIALLAPSSIISAEKKKKKAHAEDVPVGEIIEVDPVGQPASYLKRAPGQGPRLFVWWADDAWHIRAAANAKRRPFDGKIRVEGGKVTKVFNFQGLETGRKSDRGSVDNTRTIITFQFRGTKSEDGFDFTVSPTATSLHFELTMDGYAHPEAIAIGAKGSRAPNATFTLPAHPKNAQSQEKKE